VRKLILFVLPAVLAGALLSSACNKKDAAAAGEPANKDAAAKPAEPPKPMPAELPAVVARVNGQDVKKEDFEMLVRNLEMGGPIPAERRDEILRQQLERLITYTVLRQEITKRNITVPDAELDQQLNAMRSQFQNEDDFKKALAARSMTIERLRDDARVDMCITRMLDGEVATAEPATDDEVKQFYEKNPDKFKQGEAVRASHILLLVDEKADDVTRKKARTQIDAILARAKKGEDFAELARAHSQDGSAAQGGDLNFFTRGRMVPEFEQAAFALQPGQISDVVTTQYGYHVIKVTERRAPTMLPLDKVSPQVKQYLTNQKKQQKADAFVADLRKHAKVEVLV
jgi:peptidyl-prolyl cis-trans isomerase C